MKFERKGWLLVVVRYAFSIGDIKLLAKGARAQPEAVTKMELRGVAAARVRHWKEKPDETLRIIVDRRGGTSEINARRVVARLLSRVSRKREILSEMG